MKWITTDYKGDKKVWYSEDVIEKTKQLTKDYLTDCQGFKCDAMNEILQILDEVEQWLKKKKLSITETMLLTVM